MEENKNVLDEINKGACMGKDSIHYILDKVENKKLRKELNYEYDEYDRTIKKIGKIYNDYSKEKPTKTTTMNKVMTFYGIEMKTMMDTTSSHIAELMLQGTNMGIIEGRKLLNNKKVSKEVYKILEEFITFQEENVENLKEFL